MVTMATTLGTVYLVISVFKFIIIIIIVVIIFSSQKLHCLIQVPAYPNCRAV
jgi:hypothetical protein